MKNALVFVCSLYAYSMTFGTGVSATTLGRLARCGAPGALLVVLLYLSELHGNIPRDLHAVELFAGQGEMTRAFQVAGQQAVSYDVLQDEDAEDFGSTVGFLNAIHMVRHLCSLVSLKVTLTVSMV